MQNCLGQLEKDMLTSIAIPAIGTGNLGFPRPKVAEIFFEEVTNYLTAHPQSTINDVRFVAYDKDQATVVAFLGLSCYFMLHKYWGRLGSAGLRCVVLCCLGLGWVGLGWAGLCCAVLCCAVLCCAVLCCAVLCCAVLCCAVLCCAVLCCAVLCCAVLCCAVLCCAVLCCAVLCCAVLCCAVLCCAVLCCAVL